MPASAVLAEEHSRGWSSPLRGQVGARWIHVASVSEASECNAEGSAAAATASFAASVTAMGACARRRRWDQALLCLRKRHAEFPPCPIMKSAEVNSVHQLADVLRLSDKVLLGTVPLVVLLASNVNSVTHLQRLRCCLASITAQFPTKPMLVLASVSAEAPELMQEVELEFAEFDASNDQQMKVHAIFHSHRRSQFSHFAALVPVLQRVTTGDGQKSKAQFARNQQSLGTIDSLWLMFTGDEDIWHPRRTHMCQKAVLSSVSGPRAPVAIPHYAVNISDEPECSSYEDVDRMLRSQRARVMSRTLDEAREGPYLELRMHAVPARVLLDFLACTPHTTIEHRLCSIRFSTFLRDHAGAPTVFLSDASGEEDWMYYHRQDPTQAQRGLSFEAEVEAADIGVANRLRLQLGVDTGLQIAADAGGPMGDPTLADDLLALLIAQVRRDVEMLVLYGQLEADDIAEAALLRHDLLSVPDAAIWKGVAAEIAKAVVPVLAPPGWIIFDNVGWRPAAGLHIQDVPRIMPGGMPGGPAGTAPPEDEVELVAATASPHTSPPREGQREATGASAHTAPGASVVSERAAGKLPASKGRQRQTAARRPEPREEAVVGGVWLPGGGDVRSDAGFPQSY